MAGKTKKKKVQKNNTFGQVIALVILLVLFIALARTADIWLPVVERYF